MSSHPGVLFLDNSSTFGGAIVSLGHLVDGLVDRGVRPVVISGHPDERLVELFPRAETVSVDVSSPQRDPTTFLQRMRRDPPRSDMCEKVGLRLAAVDWHIRRTLPAALTVARLGRSHDVDIVHLNNSVEGQLDGVLAARLLGVPCVAHARGFQTPGHLVRAAVKIVDHHIAISRSIAQNLEEVGVAADRTSIVPDAIDVEHFSRPRDTDELRASLGIPLDAPAFGLLGRVVDWKGTREFVEAAGRVLKNLPAARAVVVGDVSDGNEAYLEEVRTLARSTGVGDRILFTGYRDDIPGLMQALDLVVHCSIEPEPFGMVIIEAMAAGTPVIAADRGGPRDIVDDGTTGILVDPRKTEALASAIERMLRDPDLAREMGRAGRERARRRYHHDRYADDVLGIYSRLLE